MKRTIAESDLIRKRLLLKGIVQGVGFRPFLYERAREHGVTGFAANTMNGLQIEAEGERENVRAFVSDVLTQPPARAEILSAEETEVLPVASDAFEISESQESGAAGPTIAPDSATCADCIAEIFDPEDRRYGYSFISCIQCGPRYSISKKPPFDRATTSMSDFRMCKHCESEYRNPGNRRFHSQTNCCPACGPRLWLADNGGREIDIGDPLAEAVHLLKEGRILAVKGLGGFHLVVNAEDERAVALLRDRKQRPAKPFAIMSAGVAEVLRYAEVSEAERAALTSPAAPIVLLKKKPHDGIAVGIAPGLDCVGVMLAYTPLHHLLLQGSFLALVMTSANRTGEPLIHRNKDAVPQLADICDYFLLHDRDIIRRCDDSILRFAGTTPIYLRHSRGLVPRPILLERNVNQILAYGAHQKNTATITAGCHAHTSRYIGDLDHLKTIDALEEACEELEESVGVIPEASACDLHPDYASTRIAEEWQKARLYRVQHHHAHALSCMAENHLLKEEVLGVVFDGAGLGPDGNIWGSEFLAVAITGFQRLAHMRYVSMPGGEAAVREPYRMALSYLFTTFGESALERAMELLPDIEPGRMGLILDIIRQQEFAPLTCGMGRLFDAVAALLGLCTRASYESEGPSYLESIAAERVSEAYEFHLDQDEMLLVDPSPVLIGILRDIRRGIPSAVISAKFHNAVSGMILHVCTRIRTDLHLNTVVLSGGVFQNRYLLQNSVASLRASGFETFTHKYLPPNDECISLGQAIAADERERCVLQSLPE